MRFCGIRSACTVCRRARTPYGLRVRLYDRRVRLRVRSGAYGRVRTCAQIGQSAAFPRGTRRHKARPSRKYAYACPDRTCGQIGQSAPNLLRHPYMLPENATRTCYPYMAPTRTCYPYMLPVHVRSACTVCRRACTPYGLRVRLYGLRVLLRVWSDVRACTAFCRV